MCKVTGCHANGTLTVKGAGCPEEAAVKVTWISDSGHHQSRNTAVDNEGQFTIEVDVPKLYKGNSCTVTIDDDIQQAIYYGDTNDLVGGPSALKREQTSGPQGSLGCGPEGCPPVV